MIFVIETKMIHGFNIYFDDKFFFKKSITYYIHLYMLLENFSMLQNHFENLNEIR